MGVFTADAGKLLEEFSLPLVKIGGSFHLDNHQMVPPAVALQNRYPLAAHPENPAGLGPFGNFHGNLAVQSRDFEFAAECRLAETNRQFADDIVSFPREDGMFAYRYIDVKVAVRSPLEPLASLT